MADTDPKRTVLQKLGIGLTVLCAGASIANTAYCMSEVVDGPSAQGAHMFLDVVWMGGALVGAVSALTALLARTRWVFVLSAVSVLFAMSYYVTKPALADFREARRRRPRDPAEHQDLIGQNSFEIVHRLGPQLGMRLGYPNYCLEYTGLEVCIDADGKIERVMAPRSHDARLAEAQRWIGRSWEDASTVACDDGPTSNVDGVVERSFDCLDVRLFTGERDDTIRRVQLVEDCDDPDPAE